MGPLCCSRPDVCVLLTSSILNVVKLYRFEPFLVQFRKEMMVAEAEVGMGRSGKRNFLGNQKPFCHKPIDS